MLFRNSGLAVVLAALLAASPLVAQERAESPADLYGRLFEAVQGRRIFADSKTFVDATPRLSVQQIIAEYAAQPPVDEAALRRFVEARFGVPGQEGETAAPVVADGLPLREHIAALWPVLTRPALEPAPGSSALALPAPYVVPGGRFREIYYWDSYFTMLGLKADGQDALVESMIENFETLIARYGHIPNGARTYYLSRSQPPFFALMVGLSDRRDPASRRRQLSALRGEHAFWMSGAACARTAGDCDHVVRMPDGSLLNRYRDARETPRDESWAEDVATAKQAPRRPAAEVYRELRSGAESGWDFSSRWLDDPRDLATIQTTDIVPIDLNSLLWSLERTIAAHCRELADATCVAEYDAMAGERRRAMDRYLWSAPARRFGDWDRRSGQMTPHISAAALYPLFVGLATPDQAAGIAALVETQLLAPGGLRTTTVDTGQQWDSPNGWAPLQWVGVEGLRRYGHDGLAERIGGRWLRTVDRVYGETGKMLEKYDIETQRPGGGGEYPLQDGFGWTNGVTRVLLDLYAAQSQPRPAPASLR